MRRDAAEIGVAMIELAIDLCRSNAEITDALSINRRLINEIGRSHRDLWDRMAAYTIRRREDLLGH